MILNPSMKPSRRNRRRSSQRFLAVSRDVTAVRRSLLREVCSSTRRRYSARTPSSTLTFWVFSSSAAISALRVSLLMSESSSLVYRGSSSASCSSPRSLECVVSFEAHRFHWDDSPDRLDGQLAKLFRPVFEPFLVLCQGFVVFFELVLHLNLYSTSFVNGCGLLVEFSFELVQLLLLSI